MVVHRVFAVTGLVTATIRAGGTAFGAMGLVLAAAGTASADDGKPIHHIVSTTAKAAEHSVGGTRTNVHHTDGGTATNAEGLIGGLERDVRSLFGGLDRDVRNFFVSLRSTPLGRAPGTAVSHPINSRSLQQIQSLEIKDSNLFEIIEQSGIDNNNAEAALEELQQEREILIKANTLAEGIQGETIPNTQEKQVLTYIGQAQVLQDQAHARLRNNIN
jgi:hypothetical protein